ncbi:ribonuclease subunit [Hirsutella rhossiliensis]|uniref:Ribonuclease subunit domain-containing protein n=1 Tax=Hirsutella rhossiliensis TaxID=111463 RepID=A0A9P8N9S6_9HYPO|nr:ribonuclease subunit domain-containing protein [Hirsutella rhossiliensis]KAH0968354.1 ribonuclease subunit domain-containing protein [Hirsutella rhossiliensis]
MFPQPSPSIYQSSACFVTYGTMGHVDRKQLPQRGNPWTAIAAQDFIHKVDLIAPQEFFSVLYEKLVEQRQQPVYARVTMTLGQLLEANFLTECIKEGDALMLSEGRTTTDNVFALHKGVLKMYLDKETYERAGLTGKPHGPKGNRGLKPSWVVSYDLMSPAMMIGKKGFDRLVYACQSVLNTPLTWLYCNADPSTSGLDPLERYKPTYHTVAPAVVQKRQVPQVELGVPASILAEEDRSGLEETATELYEWLSLHRLQSPRATLGDAVDPFLSRYSIPCSKGGQAQICLLNWHGFLGASWLRDLITDALETCPPHLWVSISATGFPRSVPGNANDLTLLRASGTANEYLMWEAKGSD